MNDPEAARGYHRLTMHDPSGLRPNDPRLVRDYQPLRWDRKPPQFKTYPGLEAILLPDDISLIPGGGLGVGLLSRLLFLSAGVVRTADLAGEKVYFRAAGSAGNLSPVEVYVVTGDMAGLDAGVYHYEPVEHALVRLGDAPAETPPALVLTGVPWRTAWKYRERGFRHLYWDAGTMLAQTLALAEEAGLVARVELGFVDHVVAALVGADGVHEVALAVVPLTGASTTLPDPDEVTVGHLADDPLEFPLVTLAQRAGDLATDEDVEGWRRAAAPLGTPRVLRCSIPAPAPRRGDPRAGLVPSVRSQAHRSWRTARRRHGMGHQGRAGRLRGRRRHAPGPLPHGARRRGRGAGRLPLAIRRARAAADGPGA